MDIIRKFQPPASGELQAVAHSQVFNGDRDRRVALRCSSERVDRGGDIVLQRGIDLTSFARNPVILWNHGYEKPIARAVEFGISGSYLEAICQFPPPGVSALADQIYGLVRADIVRGVSIGFRVVEREPLDIGNPIKGPQRFTKSELWEISIVTVPANIDGAVTWKFAEGGERERRVAEVKRLGGSKGSDVRKRSREVELLRLRCAS